MPSQSGEEVLQAPHIRIAALVVAALALAPGARGEQSREDFATRLLEALRVESIACADSGDAQPAETLCAIYRGSFSSLKSDVSDLLRRLEFADVYADDGWSLRGGRYRCPLEVHGKPVELSFESDGRRITLHYGDAEVAQQDNPSPGEEQPAAETAARLPQVDTSGPHAVYDGPFFSGIAGATPAKVVSTSAVSPVYPIDARVDKVGGSVIVEAYATRDGGVDRVGVMSCDRPGYGFEAASIAAVEQWRFDPGTRDGKAVDLFFTLVFEFKIEP